MPAKELVEVVAKLRHETESAYLVDDGTRKVWLPKSQVEYDEDEGVFVVPVWLATEKELI